MVQERLAGRKRPIVALRNLDILEQVEPQRNGARFALWSTFRELLGWSDDAGPMPRSMVFVGWVLAVALFILGVVAAAVLDYLVLGIISALIGIGLVCGTFELS